MMLTFNPTGIATADGGALDLAAPDPKDIDLAAAIEALEWAALLPGDPPEVIGPPHAAYDLAGLGLTAPWRDLPWPTVAETLTERLRQRALEAGAAGPAIDRLG